MNVKTKRSILPILLYTLLLHGQNVQADSESALIKIKQLVLMEEASPGVSKRMFWPAGVDEAVRVFIQVLPEINFEPDYLAAADKNSSGLDGTIAIKATNDFVLDIMGTSMTKSLDLLNHDDPILTAIDMYLMKLNKAIDPSWQKTCGSTLSISVGPEAMNDPKRKQEYLDLIKKNQNDNLKTSQQRELRAVRREFFSSVAYILKHGKVGNWTRENAIKRFCKDKESEQVLEERLKNGF